MNRKLDIFGLCSFSLLAILYYGDFVSGRVSRGVLE